jgi:hypothetical protein
MNQSALFLMHQIAVVVIFLSGCSERESGSQPDQKSNRKIEVPEFSFDEIVELANQSDEVAPGAFRTLRILGKERIEISVGTSVKPMSGGGQLIQFVRTSGKWEIASIEDMDF